MLVNTTLGSLLGVALPAGCDQWLGVPYGHAVRFQPAEVRTLPYATSPLPALDFGPACLQFLTNTTTYGSEHGCFVLNIWRPSDATPSDKLPVLVYVPGGENAFGEAGPYNASELAVAQRAVVVGVNYRVGPFGFLSFAEDVEAGRGTGNWAQTDVQAALQWVRREIGAFGGDPTRTTLFGQSSGGGLVLNHAFSARSAIDRATIVSSRLRRSRHPSVS
jgi:para-nitrobenzyl esterase